jgi:hypothetical protein
VGATAQLAEPSERLTAERRPISLVLAQEGCEPFRSFGCRADQSAAPVDDLRSGGHIE